MKYLLVIISLLTGTLTKAQVTWVHDLAHAKSLAAAESKLIVIDFWATWCGPCKTMDHELWNTEEANTFKDRAIFVKINIDNHRDIAMRFGIKSIPDVRVIDIAENIYWSENGFRNKNNFINTFSVLPQHLLNLNDYLLKSSHKKATAGEHFNTAKALLFMTRKLENKDWRDKMYIQSLDYLKMSRKKDKSLAMQCELWEYTGLCLTGKEEQAGKKLNRVDPDGLSGPEKEIYALVQALIYMKERNKEQFVTSFSKVKNPFLKSLVRK